ncbi:DUF2085 domain-containing protein [Balneolales bacterium ANBcel1]|nr:DUF2085 domain-containing protein [Balneolales bacterium ANBcel1]
MSLASGKPSTPVMKLDPLLSTIAIGIAAFLALTAWSPPLFYGTITEWAGSWPQSLFSFVCHQQIDRALFINEVPLAACSRCTGIYTGLLAGIAGSAFFFTFGKVWNRYITGIFFLVSIVLVSDGFANLLDLWRSSNHTRLLLGTAWGLSAGIMLATALTVAKPKQGG